MFRKSFNRVLSAGAVALAVVAGGAVAAPTATGATSTHAGAGIVIHDGNGGGGMCTLNSVAEKDGTYYGTTAAHCLNPDELGANPEKITTESGQLLADKEDIAAGGFVTGGSASPFDVNASLDDFGWFRLDESVTANASSVSSTANTGIPLLDDALRGHSQPLGEPVPISQGLVGRIVCKDGTMSGRTCGPVLDVNVRTQEITALIPAIAGDSGSPLHIAGRDGKRHIVGALSNGTPVLFNTFDGTREHLPKVGA